MTFDEYGNYYGRPGRYVSFYAAQYVVDGGNLAVLADGTKEYSIKDHLGSVRVVASTSGQLRQYDYKPYGDTLQSGSYNNLRGYEGSERDPESRYMNLGARLSGPDNWSLPLG